MKISPSPVAEKKVGQRGGCFEVHLHLRAAVKGLDKQRLTTSERGLQAQLEVTVSAYRRAEMARLKLQHVNSHPDYRRELERVESLRQQRRDVEQKIRNLEHQYESSPPRSKREVAAQAVADGQRATAVLEAAEQPDEHS